VMRLRWLRPPIFLLFETSVRRPNGSRYVLNGMTIVITWFALFLIVFTVVSDCLLMGGRLLHRQIYL
jgi:hypothetical protein